MTSNIRHDLDPALVQEQIEKNIGEILRRKASAVEGAQKALARYEQHVAEGLAHRWPRKPDPEQIGGCYDNMVATERTYYAKARVIELPQEGNRFILVYGDADDATVEFGTGPFATLDEASGWFFRGGR